MSVSSNEMGPSQSSTSGVSANRADCVGLPGHLESNSIYWSYVKCKESFESEHCVCT